MISHRSRRKVQLADTDRSGNAHFSRILVFVEEAEHEFLAIALGNPFGEIDGGSLAWPRRKIECQFRHPLNFGDEIEIELALEIGAASMSYSFILQNGTRLAAEGRVALGCCLVRQNGILEAIHMPAEVRRRLLLRDNSDT